MHQTINATNYLSASNCGAAGCPGLLTTTNFRAEVKRGECLGYGKLNKEQDRTENILGQNGAWE
jgi:hypothetical protein